MRKRALFASAVLLFLASISTSALAGKMDLPLRMSMAAIPAAKAGLVKSIETPEGVRLADVLIKSTDPAATEEAIEGSGGRVRSVVADILTAYVPMGALAEIEAMPEVVAIEASRRLRNLMDTARSSANTNVEAVQADGYSGSNVVVGVIDSGLDYSRADFDAADGATRVQYLRFQSVNAAGDVSIAQCAKDYIDDGDCGIAASNDATVGHGTHVTGIAASSDATYTGVAPAADIMLVRNDFYDDISEGGADSGTFSGGVIDGVVEIFKKSDIIDKPAVVNLSQGTHIGAHDNSSLLEQTMNSAVTGGYASGGKGYGRVITVAAGNEHVVSAALAGSGLGTFEGGIHAGFSVPDGESHAYRLWILDAGSLAGVPYLTIDTWFGTGQASNCTIAANAYKYSDIFDAGGAAFDPPPALPATDVAVVAIPDAPLATEAEATDQDAVAAVGLAVDPSDVNNSKPRALILYGPADGTSWDSISVTGAGNSSYFLDIIVRANGGNCSGNMWIEGGDTFADFMGGIDAGGYDIAAGANGAAYEMMDGDSDSTITVPGTASGVITVGAYLQTKPEAGCPSQSCWTDMDGTQYDATDITTPDPAAEVNGGTVQGRTPFSSIGPAVYAYSGHKPDVLAPGDPIISTLPTGHTVDAALMVDDTHYKSQGTSQSSPHVAGVAALLLEKNNTLTASQVKEKLIFTATKSGSPNDLDGYGNVKASAALAAVSADTSGYSGTGNLSQADLDGGGGGSSGGCGGTMAPMSGHAAGAMAAVLLAPLVALAAVRRRRR